MKLLLVHILRQNRIKSYNTLKTRLSVLIIEKSIREFVFFLLSYISFCYNNGLKRFMFYTIQFTYLGDVT